MSKEIEDFATPFDALKTADQSVYFANDPTHALTRQRYGWYSNGTLFDSQFHSSNQGELQVQTGSSGTDSARLRSALAGQYVSQALAQPGLKVGVPSSNTSLDSNNYSSLDSGRIAFGPFWHDGTQITTGFGIEFNTSGAEIFWKSGGTHKGNSPIPQDEWNRDEMDAKGESDLLLDPAKGFVYNFPYTWYNAGPLTVGLISAKYNGFFPMHTFSPPEDAPGGPSLETPNLPVQLLVENDGDASATTATLGGMQYTLYGADGVREVRHTLGEATGRSVTTDTPAAPNPITTPGDPIFAVRRRSGNDDLEVELTKFFATATDDIRVYVWDVWDDSTALTGASWEETFNNNSDETKTEFDRSATDFTVTSNTLLRDASPITSGQKNESVVGGTDVDSRLPIGATRVLTATDDNSTDPTVSYIAKTDEGY